MNVVSGESGKLGGVARHAWHAWVGQAGGLAGWAMAALAARARNWRGSSGRAVSAVFPFVLALFFACLPAEGQAQTSSSCSQFNTDWAGVNLVGGDPSQPTVFKDTNYSQFAAGDRLTINLTTSGSSSEEETTIGEGALFQALDSGSGDTLYLYQVGPDHPSDGSATTTLQMQAGHQYEILAQGGARTGQITVRASCATVAAAPTLSAASPASGSTAGGTSVTLTGTNLLGATSVTFGGTAASITGSTATSVTVTVPAHAAGAVDIAVTAPGGSTTLASGYTYLAAPTLSTASPASGSTAGGTSVTLTGTNLAGATSVIFGGTAASITGSTATSVTVTVPAHAAGAVDIAVTAPGGSTTLALGYTYLAVPTLSAASPSSGSTAGGALVTLTGTNLAGATSVIFGGTAASITGSTATSVTVTVPAHAAGVVNIAVTAPGGSTTLASGYTYLAVPTLSAASPASGPTAGGTSVTLTGTNLLGATSATFGGTAASITGSTATSVTVTVPAHAAGVVNIAVTAPGGSTTLASGYTYLAVPTLSAASPASGPTAGGTSVTLTGTNLLGATSATFGGTAASITGSTATSVTVTVPAHAAGAVDIAVTAPGGSTTLASGYTYLGSTTVTAASPTSGSTAGGTSVTLTGTNLAGATSVTFGGTAASITGSTATSVTVTAPAHAAGAVGIAVTARGGTATLNNAYTYVAALTLSPPAGALPGGTLGTAYRAAVALSGGVAPYRYALAAGALPAGLALDPQTGALAGTPSVVGSSSFMVSASDATGASVSAAYSLTISGAAPVANAVSVTVASNSAAYTVVPALTGGAPTSVAIVTQARHGTAAASGVSLTYTPAPGFSGTDSFTYTAANASGTSAPATVSVTVTAPALAFTPAAGALAAGAAGTAYSVRIAVSQGTAPYVFSVSAGALPAGLSLDPSTGVISGTPTGAGTANFSITVRDANGASATAAYTLTVGGLAPVAKPVAATVAANSASTAIALDVGGGTPVSIAIVTPARHGTVVVSKTSIAYTPAPGFSGADSFTYTATNASGTSAPATVDVTVAPPRLDFAPAAGTLPGATVGTAYRQTVTVTGGTAPYRYAVGGALPAGLSFADGVLSGTPSAPGTASFTVTVTDANGATGQAAFSLVILGAAPVAMSRTVQLVAGASTTIDLTAGATGGPFVGAAIVSGPSASEGSATLSGGGGAYRLAFASKAQAAGTVVVRYTLSNQWQTSAVAAITYTIVARPDPSKDAEVIGIVNAEAQSAERFATTQISNFGSRLERLHDERTRQADSFKIQFGVTQSDARGTPPDASPAQNPAALAGQPQPPSGLPAGVTAARDASHDSTRDSARDPTSDPARKATARGTAGPDDAQAPVAADRLAFWTGGFVNFGTSDTAVIRLSHTLVGVSGGMDYRFSPDFTAGVGAGYGRDVSDIGENGSGSTGQAFSAAFYGSYHPGPVFVDGLLGLSHLDFDSTRFVTATGDTASGSRGGTQFFGSLSSGYEYRAQGWMVSPYGRFQAAWTRLDDFTESGAGMWNLTYADQSLSMLAAVAGLRGEYGIPLSWGVLGVRGRVEYTHDFAGSSRASLGYADLGTTPYGVDVLGLSHNSMSVEFGIEAQLEHGVALSFGYQGSFGFENSAQDHTFLVKLRSRF